LFAAATANVF